MALLLQQKRQHKKKKKKKKKKKTDTYPAMVTGVLRLRAGMDTGGERRGSSGSKSGTIFPGLVLITSASDASVSPNSPVAGPSSSS
jgi:hypothetical protein